VPVDEALAEHHAEKTSDKVLWTTKYNEGSIEVKWVNRKDNPRILRATCNGQLCQMGGWKPEHEGAALKWLVVQLAEYASDRLTKPQLEVKKKEWLADHGDAIIKKRPSAVMKKPSAAKDGGTGNPNAPPEGGKTGRSSASKVVPRKEDGDAEGEEDGEDEEDEEDEDHEDDDEDEDDQGQSQEAQTPVAKKPAGTTSPTKAEKRKLLVRMAEKELAEQEVAQEETVKKARLAKDAAEKIAPQVEQDSEGGGKGITNMEKGITANTKDNTKNINNDLKKDSNQAPEPTELAKLEEAAAQMALTPPRHDPEVEAACHAEAERMAALPAALPAAPCAPRAPARALSGWIPVDAWDI